MCSGKRPLQVKSEQEALYLACEMERRAIRVYERGLMLSQDPALSALLQKLVSDERVHLAKFSRMGNTAHEATGQEQQILLKSVAAQILFPGGLMQAQREGALSNMVGLLAFAKESEETAIKCYLEFSESCQSIEAKDAFLSIANEEKAHLDAIEKHI